MRCPHILYNRYRPEVRCICNHLFCVLPMYLNKESNSGQLHQLKQGTQRCIITPYQMIHMPLLWYGHQIQENDTLKCGPGLTWHYKTFTLTRWGKNHMQIKINLLNKQAEMLNEYDHQILFSHISLAFV